MKKTLLVSILMAFYVMALSGHIFAADPTGKDIMKRQKELHKVKSEAGEETMLLVDNKSQSKEKRTIRRYGKDFGSDLNHYLVVFIDPADIKGTALLTWEQKGDKNDQWLYMPATKKMQRIAEGSKKTYFMGTDFTYEDMEPEDIDSFNYTIIKTEKINQDKKDYDCYVIEAIPSNPEKARKSGYSKRILWIEKQNLYTVKAEFYDKRNKLQKTQYAYDFDNITGTVWRPKKALMDNFSKDHKTLSMTKERKVNQPIDDSTFTERFILTGNHVK